MAREPGSNRGVPIGMGADIDDPGELSLADHIPGAGETVSTLRDVVTGLPQIAMEIGGQLPDILHVPTFEREREAGS